MKYAVSGNIPTIPTLEKSPTRPILMSGKNFILCVFWFKKKSQKLLQI